MINFFKDAGGFMEDDEVMSEIQADAIYEEERERRAGVTAFTERETDDGS